MKIKEYIGCNCTDKLSELLVKKKVRKILLVTGKKSFAKSGAQKIFDKQLRDFETIVFADFTTNPQYEDVLRGIELLNKENPDIVIACGGGSVIDMAKLMSVLSQQDGDALEYIKGNTGINTSGKPVIAVPTTCGSGSEATHFAVVYVDKQKHSLAHEYLLPEAVFVDPKLTMSLDKYITATSGLDSLSQAIESYWNINSTNESIFFAKKALELSYENLEKSVNSPDIKSREGMSKAAYYAGKAINITKTTAPHSISYPLTSYFGIPHGHAVALTLPKILEYNYYVNEKDVNDIRGVRHVKGVIDDICSILGEKNVALAADLIKKLILKIGLKVKLSDLGLKEEDIGIIIKNGFDPDRVKNNPRLLTEEHLNKILMDIL